MQSADKALLQSGRMHWRVEQNDHKLLQSIIDENVRSGFMHNDLHLENVVFDRDTYTLRTLDYGRVILDRVYMPKYTSNDIIDAVEPFTRHHRHSRYKERMAMEHPEQPKADYKTVAEDLRWSTDIMKVCVMYHHTTGSKPRRSL
jgi:hypothetical protein